MKLKLPESLAKVTLEYNIIKDEVGMSPTEVFKLVNENRTLYLKISGKQFKNTTYDVEREKNMLLWLENKIPIPKVIQFESDENFDYLLMTEIEGICLSQVKDFSPCRVVDLYADCIKKLQSIDISECTFNSDIKLRLSELNYLLENKLAAEDDFWEGDTKLRFASPEQLVMYLNENIPEEDLTFSHGDLCNGNIIVKDNSISGYIDWARGGKADKWYDIAFCVRSIRNELYDEKYVELFFNLLGIEPNWEKINYFILLDELF